MRDLGRGDRVARIWPQVRTDATSSTFAGAKVEYEAQVWRRLKIVIS
jgi:hypothetical protein